MQTIKLPEQNRHAGASGTSAKKIASGCKAWVSTHSSKFFILVLLVSMSLGTVGCKSSKKAKERAAAEQAEADRISQAKADLMKLLDDSDPRSISEKEEELRRIKNMNIDDAEVNALIRQVEAKLASLKEAEASRTTRTDESASARLNNYFNAISTAGSTGSANNSINEALSLFSSPDAPVLIIISKDGSQVDYDKPTTIRRYLNYVKDQRQHANEVEEIVTDDDGKIKELVLIKR